MFICNCNGVRCREVDEAIRAGARNPRGVLAHHGHEPCCGRCLPEIADRLLAERGRSCTAHSALMQASAPA